MLKSFVLNRAHFEMKSSVAMGDGFGILASMHEKPHHESPQPHILPENEKRAVKRF